MSDSPPPPALAPAPPGPGDVLLGRYRLDEPIGAGGMAAVFRATDLKLKRTVAVKLVQLAGGNRSPEVARLAPLRLRREAEFIADVVHPNVVAVYDVDTDARSGVDFLVMEHLRGCDLRRWLAGNGPRVPARAAEILLQAARGLAAGHARGIVHRDVKPSNLFVTDEGGELRVRIVDFGIAKPVPGDPRHQDLTLHAPFVSAGYSSPEQRMGRPVTRASDVFSLGVVGYELMTGSLPHPVADRRRLEAALAAPVPPSAWSPATWSALRDVVLTALHEEPAERFPTAAEMVRALAGALGEPFRPAFSAGGDATLPMAAAPRPPFTRRRRAAPRRRGFPGARSAALGAGSLAVALALGRWLWPDAGPGDAADRFVGSGEPVPGAASAALDPGVARPLPGQPRASRSAREDSVLAPAPVPLPAPPAAAPASTPTPGSMPTPIIRTASTESTSSMSRPTATSRTNPMRSSAIATSKAADPPISAVPGPSPIAVVGEAPPGPAPVAAPGREDRREREEPGERDEPGNPAGRPDPLSREMRSPTTLPPPAPRPRTTREAALPTRDAPAVRRETAEVREVRGDPSPRRREIPPVRRSTEYADTVRIGPAVRGVPRRPGGLRDTIRIRARPRW